MSGHCAVANKKGVILFAYHIEDFIELTEDET